MPPKPCMKKVRDGSKLVPCGTPVVGEQPCKNRANHMLPMTTGKCAEGWCEGTKPRTVSGGTAPTCDWINTCPCKCHQDLWWLFEVSGMERIPVDKSNYHPETHTFWMPSDDITVPIDESSDTPVPDTPAPLESPLPANVAPSRTHSFAVTPTGRAARGQLEDWVKKQCDIWLIEGYSFPCTPAWISVEIGHDEGVDPPSVGAISAVFDRWVKLGFAVVDKKPTRFSRYTEEGLRIGLDAMKARAKSVVKRRKADLRRGIR